MRARPLAIARAAARIVAFSSFSTFFTTFVHAQAPAARDRVPALPPGKGVIKGRVVDAQTGNALARARVRLQAPGNPTPVMTDDTGAFTIASVPAGSWYLSVDRSGYMSTMYPEPKKTIRTSMRGLPVEEGQVVERVTIALSRGSAITGRIVDAHGEPAEGVQVQLFRVAASGRSRPQQRSGAGTNDLGEFRVPRLEPGSYLLRAQGRTWTSSDDPSDVQPAPVYYPGVVSMEQAQPITLERGQTVSGIELMLIDATSTVVSGSVLDAKGSRRVSGPTSTHVRSVTSTRRSLAARLRARMARSG